MKKITRNVKDFEIYKQEVTRPETLEIGGWELGGVDTGKQKKNGDWIKHLGVTASIFTKNLKDF